MRHGRDTHLAAYRFMLLARLLDDKFAALYRAGKIHGGVFLGRGQEALSVAVGLSLKKGDVFAPLIRDTAGRLAFGEPCLTPCGRISARRSARCAAATATSIAAGRRRVICRWSAISAR
jgi:TPP-dependent pyruvate/acetoin dehydrogenase alpha subunit